jgi:hypothetical protein
MAISHDRAQNSTVAVVLGAKKNEADHLMELLKHDDDPSHWSSLPLAVLEMGVTGFSSRVNDHHGEIWEIEKLLKMRLGVDDHIDLQNTDFIGATRSLNSVFAQLAMYNQVCQTSRKLLEGLEHSLDSVPSVSSTGSAIPTTDAKARITSLRSWCDGMQARCAYLTRRAEAQLQTVGTYDYPRSGV